MSDPRERYWRSLDELLGRPELRESLAREFPAAAELPPDWVGRRSFVKLLGASLALAGLGGCVSRPRERILPYVARQPELTPAAAEHYATTMTLDGYGTGLLAESHAGRPTKLEGNPDHPASLGAAGVYEQASVLGLYDPQRARSVRDRGRPGSWAALLGAIAAPELRRTAGARGGGLHLLLEPSASPLEAELLARVRERWPDVHVHRFAPLADPAAEEAGAVAAFGRVVQPVYDFAAAELVLAVEADFLAAMPFHLRYARDFATRRRVTGPSDAMSRMYAIETALTVTGGMADHRLRAPPGEIPAIVAAIAAQALGGGMSTAGEPAAPASSADGERAAWIDAAARDLVAHRGRCAIVAGPRQPAAVHALVHALNAALGNVGRTVRYIASQLPAGLAGSGIVPLADALRVGEVAWLVVLGGNPAYTAPADLDFTRLLRGVPRSAYLGLYRDETARGCRWFLPARHYLETWGDARAWDGTVSLVQPLIAPLYDGRTGYDVLAALAGAPDDGHTLLRETWRQRRPGHDFDRFWDEALQRGVVPDTAAPAVPVKPHGRAGSTTLIRAAAALPAPDAGGIEVVLAPDASVHDGRFANNPWLQELPDPITKLTWGNAAMLAPRTAARLGVASGHSVEITAGRSRLTIPVLVVPGHADGALTIPLGYGRTAGDAAGEEQVAAGVGANGFALRTAACPFVAAAASVRPVTSGPVPARAHPDTLADGRAADRARRHARGVPPPAGAHAGRAGPAALALPARAVRRARAVGDGHRPVHVHRLQRVRRRLPGGEQHPRRRARRACSQSREMHWLRIDRYFAGTPDEPDVVHAADALPALREGAVRVRLPGRARPCTAPTASTRWSTTAASARASAPTTARTRCAGSTGSTTTAQMHRDRAAGEEPGRHRPRARRDGEVHLLRAAHPRAPRSPRGSTAARCAPARCDRVPAGVPDRARSSSARSTEPDARRGAAGASEPRAYAVLRRARHRPARALSRADPQPEPGAGASSA